MRGIIAVFIKDLKSEFRTRHALTALLLFVVNTIVMILFATRHGEISGATASGVLWVIIFFSAMSGLSKSFVSEEERGTSMLLRMNSAPAAVYFGKLLFNTVLALGLTMLAGLLFAMFFPVAIARPGLFILSMVFGSLGLASATTIISALIAKAGSKGALFPVLSFPILLPLIILGVSSTTASITGSGSESAFADFRLMTAYCGLLVTASYFLFEAVWCE